MSLIVVLPLLTIYTATKLYRPQLTKNDRLALLWFILSGSLHCILELYYILNFTTIAANTDFASSLWKEYAKSDSRYLAQNPLVYVLESITVFIAGPLSLSTAWCIWQQSSIGRYLGQLVVSLMHLYSAALYFGTEFIAKESNCRPELVYFAGYLVAMNLPWILVPSWLITESFGVITHGMVIAKERKNTQAEPLKVTE
ncbi:hypothetical protein FB639_003256 [Coemansia asiatica]|nr:hypothetical protein FB639_003256 [Coemansia asiatica]